MEIICIGGGISGLSSAFALQEEAAARGEDVVVRVLEAEDRLGGKIDSRQVDGFLVEGGVNGWLDSKPTTDQLCRDLGIFDQRLPSNDSARKRYIFRHGRLHRLPESPGKFLSSGLMSLAGKLRIVGELWAKQAPPASTDETLADFARRRLGKEALEALLDPMVSGIFAGDPEQMSLRSCFPRIAEVESQYGGLIRGMMKIQKEKAKARKRGEAVSGSGAAGPGGRLISFAHGAGELVEGLRQALRIPPLTGCRVERIERCTGGYRIHRQNGAPLTGDRIVLASPAWASARILNDVDDSLSRELGEIPYAAVAVVAMGWRIEDIPLDLGGFGFLIPNSEGRKLLGSLWDSSVFDHRAPPGYALIRSMVGGMRHGDRAMMPADALRQSVHEEISSIMGAQKDPEFVHIVQHDRAIPQYVPGHAERLERIDARLQQHPGLFLTGNAYRGVGLNDCTADAVRTAKRVLDSLPNAERRAS